MTRFCNQKVYEIYAIPESCKKMNLVMAETKLNAAQKELAAIEKKFKCKEKSLNQCKEIQCEAVAKK